MAKGDAGGEEEELEEEEEDAAIAEVLYLVGSRVGSQLLRRPLQLEEPSKE